MIEAGRDEQLPGYWVSVPKDQVDAAWQSEEAARQLAYTLLRGALTAYSADRPSGGTWMQQETLEMLQGAA